MACTPTEVTISEANLQTITLRFLGVTYNNVAGTSTWTYEILAGETNNEKRQLSNWLLRLCFDTVMNPDDLLESCMVVPSSPQTDCEISDPDPFPCPAGGFSGIKFDTGELDDGDTQTYTFTLTQQFAVEPTDFRLKGGGGPTEAIQCGTICGPSPECNPPSGRGVII